MKNPAGSGQFLTTIITICPRPASAALNDYYSFKMLNFTRYTTADDNDNNAYLLQQHENIILLYYYITQRADRFIVPVVCTHHVVFYALRAELVA